MTHIRFMTANSFRSPIGRASFTAIVVVWRILGIGQRAIEVMGPATPQTEGQAPGHAGG
jgi:hypothetical protein